MVNSTSIHSKWCGLKCIPRADCDFFFASASGLPRGAKKKYNRRHIFERRILIQQLFFDWLTFSLKPDPLAENKQDIDLDGIIEILKLHKEWSNFENIGGRNGYPVCWDYSGVSIMCPAPERYEQMGYCISMTGRGLEWYFSLFRNLKIHKFLSSIRSLVDTGLSLNVSRLDIALDDKPQDGKSGVLDLDVIIKKAEALEYISTSRTKATVREIIQYKGDNITGRTIYFGSRKSTSYVRIYDKAKEQGVCGHWIRVEFEFKQETAMRIVNAICLTGDSFPEYFAEVANHYLRFVELDDTNRSRCSISDFWSNFLGTVKKSTLAVAEHKRQNATKLLNYILHSIAPSLTCLSVIFPDGFLWDIIERNGTHRLKRKHYEMIENPDVWDTPHSNSEKWYANIPVSVMEQLELA